MDIAGDVYFWALAHKWWLIALCPFVIGYVVVKFLNR